MRFRRRGTDAALRGSDRRMTGKDDAMGKEENAGQACLSGESVRDSKRRLRREMRQRMLALPEAYVRAAGERMEARVLAMPAFRRAERIFVYVSVGREPSTRRILQEALASGKAVYVPKCLGKGEMAAVRIRDMADLTPGTLGIPEPRDWSDACGPADLDLILVPCVCAGRDGKRLGHGGGYYDRFLAGGAEKAVCLCFDRMLTEDIPTEETDVRMPAVLTEEAL